MLPPIHNLSKRFAVLFITENHALTLVVVQVFHNWLAMPVLGKVFALPVVAINGFFLSRHWIYKTA